MVELYIRKIGQVISNPTNIYWKRFLRRIQKETMIGIKKQFLCVLCTICSFRMLTLSSLEYFSPFKNTCALMVTHASNDGFGMLSQFSSKSLSVPFLRAVVR